MEEGSACIMEVFILLFVVALTSAADVKEVAVEKSVLDVYASSSHRPAFNSVDLYHNPVIVLANTSAQQDNGLVAYYADNGIRSIVDSRKFQPLFQLLRGSQNVSGLVVGYQGPGDNSFLLDVVREFVLPDNFKLFDLVRESVYAVPIVYVEPKGVFNQSFEGFDLLAKFVVDDFNIDQVPINKSSQSANQHSSNAQVVVVPVFTQSYPQQYSAYNPWYYQNYGYFPVKYQSYQVLNNRGTNSFPYFGLQPGFNPLSFYKAVRIPIP